MVGPSRPAIPQDKAAVNGIFDIDVSPTASESLGREAPPAYKHESFIRDILQSGIASAVDKKDKEENVPVASNRTYTT